MMRVGFLVFEGVTLLDVAGPAEVLTRAGQYELTMYSPSGGDVMSGSGLLVAGTRRPEPADAADVDTLIVAGADDLADRVLDQDLLHAATVLTLGPRRVASVCTGAFILAELGLLNGRRATTHWRNVHDLARRYPAVRVDHDALHVHDGRFISSAGISAGIDLALSLVEADLGAESARAIAQEMVMFMHRPAGQSQFAGAPRRSSVSSDILRSAIDHVESDPLAGHTVATMARAAAVSPRHLGRMFRQELGMTPHRWLEQTRLARAQRLILEGHSVTAAARNSGFGNDENLRRAFERRLQLTPTEYRARFSSTFRRT